MSQELAKRLAFIRGVIDGVIGTLLVLYGVQLLLFLLR